MPASAQHLAELPREGLSGIEPDRTTTDWGRSERLTALADATVLRFLYRYWFRVDVEGLDHVPPRGGALLVANRAGVLAADAAMIAMAVREEHPATRPVHLAAGHTFTEIPGLGMTLTKLGAVPSHPANLHRLLFDEREVVLAFPEGCEAAVKPLRLRYRLGKFDSGPFVEAAIRAQAPIVPVAAVGAEEALPSLGALRLFGRRLPLTTVVPLPAKFRVRFLEPIPTAGLTLTSAGALAQQLRARVQENLLELVAHRRSVWLG